MREKRLAPQWLRQQQPYDSVWRSGLPAFEGELRIHWNFRLIRSGVNFSPWMLNSSSGWKPPLFSSWNFSWKLTTTNSNRPLFLSDRSAGMVRVSVGQAEFPFSLAPPWEQIPKVSRPRSGDGKSGLNRDASISARAATRPNTPQDPESDGLFVQQRGHSGRLKVTGKVETIQTGERAFKQTEIKVVWRPSEA